MSRPIQIVFNLSCFLLCLVTPRKITKAARFIKGIVRACTPTGK